jgi:molybdate transport system substrate-binding protein
MLTAAALAAVLALGACGSPGHQLRVYAAASLTDAISEAAQTYKAVAGVETVLSFGASSTLRVQIEHGASADVVLSADRETIEALAAEGLVAGAPVAFAESELVIIVAASATARVTSWRDLATPGLRIIAAGPDVPLQRYADQAIEHLAALPDAPQRFAARVAANVASREGNARAVLAKVQLGEGDAAIVYATDARAAPELETRPIPESPVATYVGAVVADRPAKGAARAFLDWLAGDEGQAILAKHGFRRP